MKIDKHIYIYGCCSNVRSGILISIGCIGTNYNRTIKVINMENDITVYVNEDNKIHRKIGPACEFYNESAIWFFNGKISRLDGPAFIASYKVDSWWIDGIKYSEEDYYKQLNILKERDKNENNRIHK